MKILGIETSCDETAIALFDNEKLLYSKVSSHLIHKKYGGVVPELASREHDKILPKLFKDCLKSSKLSPVEIDLISVTQGPGLAGSLISGASFAKGLSLANKIPIIGINHLEAHIFANILSDPNLKFPFVCLLVSGGHTQLWHVNGLGKYKLLGETRDDAAGEAFDKGARILGLGYPGGPEIEKCAKNGNTKKINFPKALMSKKNLEFSFSGLKTSLLYYYRNNSKTDIADIAASYQSSIIETLLQKLSWSLDLTNCNTCVIAGGVAANSHLRNIAHKFLPKKKIIFPKMEFCTDNGAMIAYLAYLYSKNGKFTEIDFKIYPNMKINQYAV
tara:strand:+ start:6355 stop:7347 length:993 start_codon:yes stop_codon:yes gene_type:complete